MSVKSLIAVVSLSSALVDADDQEPDAHLVLELRPHATQPLAFNPTELNAKAGQFIQLTFSNQGATLAQPHNFVLVKPGKVEAVGTLATAMITDPSALKKNYIPDNCTDILAHSPLVAPGESVTIEFAAPVEPGDYPYICTFPGHWLQMRGTLHVH